MAHAYNPRTQVAETEQWHIRGQPWIHTETLSPNKMDCESIIFSYILNLRQSPETMYITWSVSLWTEVLVKASWPKSKVMLTLRKMCLFPQKYISASFQSRRDQGRSSAKCQFGFLRWRDITSGSALVSVASGLEFSSSANPLGLLWVGTHNDCPIPLQLLFWLPSLCSLGQCCGGRWQIATFQLAQVFYLSGGSCLSHDGKLSTSTLAEEDWA